MRDETDGDGQSPLLVDEGALLAALRARADAPVDVARVEVPGIAGADGQPLWFRARALGLEELSELRSKHSIWVKAEDGMHVQAVKNEAVFGAELILAATVPEDRERLWGNARLREALGVTRQRDMVLKLFSGADGMARVIEVIAGRQDADGRGRDDEYKSRD